jgi:hypothetical protein
MAKKEGFERSSDIEAIIFDIQRVADAEADLGCESLVADFGKEVVDRTIAEMEANMNRTADWVEHDRLDEARPTVSVPGIAQIETSTPDASVTDFQRPLTAQDQTDFIDSLVRS